VNLPLEGLVRFLDVGGLETTSLKPQKRPKKPPDDRFALGVSNLVGNRKSETTRASGGTPLHRATSKRSRSPWIQICRRGGAGVIVDHAATCSIRVRSLLTTNR
jgi:hypothetical protein